MDSSSKSIGASRQLAVATACFAVLITAIVTSIQMKNEFDNVNTSIENEISQVQKSTVPIMAQAVWELNLESVKTISYGLAKMPSVNYVAVHDASNTLVEFGKRSGESRNQTYELTTSTDPKTAQKIGFMEVQFDSKIEKSKLKDKYLAISVSNVLLIFMLSAFMLLVLEYRFMRHIRRLTHYVDRLGYVTLSQKFELKRMKLGALGNDEVEILTEGIERMRSKWQREFEEREKSNLELDFKSRLMTEGFGATAEISQFIASSLENLDRVLEYVVDKAVKLTDAHASSICIIEGDELRLVTYTKTTAEADEVFVNSFPRRLSAYPIYDRIKQGNLIELHDIQTDTSVPEDIKLISKFRGHQSLVMLPLMSECTVIGILSVAQSENYRFKPDQIKLLQVMSDEAAIAIKISHLFAEAKRARMVAEEANEAKANFLANMSHEIRTPMNSILGFATLIAKTNLSEKQSDYVNKIRYSGQHLLGIINDILDISKMEAGRLTIENIEFDLNSVIHNIGGLLSENAAKKGLEFTLEVDPRIPTALIGDPLRIGQILINLTNNAVKFTEEGRVSIDIVFDSDLALDTIDLPEDASNASAHRNVERLIQVKFKVTDTGIGLTKDQIDKLFNRFIQADNSTTRQYGGTGLGLAICKNLIELMHGSVGVESTPAQGSCFWFTLPLGVVKNQLATRTGIPAHYQVLVVDDDRPTLELIHEMLGQIGVQSTAVDSGHKALAAVEDAAQAGHPYDLILLDWQMPTLSGIETAQKIREMGLEKTPPMVLITGHARAEIYDGTFNEYFVDILIKPVTSYALRELIFRLNNANTSQRSGEARRRPGLSGTPQAEATDVAPVELLVVEDNLFNQQIANELLTDAGYIISLADNGQIAVDMINAKFASGSRYALVLMDMQMPVMDGVAATMRIRQQYTAQTLPIIAMTANAMQADRDRCLAAGMDDFVTKPIDPQRLFETINKWLGTEPAAAQAGHASHAASAGSEWLASLAQIPDLDVKSGLSLMGDNEKLYLNSLREFTSKAGHFESEMRNHVASRDYHAAERLAHTLKGQSAYLGARQLRASAGHVEDLLRAADFTPQDLQNDVEQMLSLLGGFVADVHTRLGPLIEAGKNAAAPQAGKSAARGIYDKFVAALKDNDPAALEILEQHSAELESTLGDQLPAIKEHLDAFRFDEALALTPSA